MNTLDGEKFSLLTKLKTLCQTGMVGEWEVMVPGENKKNVSGRICAIRKSAEAIQKVQKNVKRRAQSAGEKLKPETLEYAKYIILFTTFPSEKFTANEVLEGYRLRWQIELIFKRFKQLAQLGHLPKKDQNSVEAWLYGKLFVVLLTQRIIEHADFFSPWGYDLENIPNTKSLA